MWCPSASLSIWANAWLAGQAAPDDVLDALSCWAPRQSVTAHDPVAAGHTGLPWPDANHSGAVSVLQTLRTAAGRMAISTPAEVNHPWGPIGIVLPVPGDVRGLAAGTQFQQDALAVGEAMILTNPNDPGSAVGLVPDLHAEETDIDLPEPEALDICALNWTVYALPDAPVLDHPDLGEAEYALRSAVRSAVDSLAVLGLGSSGADGRNPRTLVEQVLEPGRQHQVPHHAPSRALRVLENAAHIDAIITVSSELMPIGTQSSSEAQIATNALRPLEAVVRSARIAAISAILRSAWQA